MSEPTSPDADRNVLNYHQPRGSDLEWVKVWTASNPMEANLAVATLIEKGFHARVDMENIATMGAWVSGKGSSTAVHVPREEASAARELLLEIDRRREARATAAKVQCPKCGARDNRRVMASIRWIGIACIPGAVLAGVLELGPLVLLMVVLAPVLLIWPLTPRWRCNACGNRWIAPETDFPEEEGEDDESGDADDRATPPPASGR